MPWNTKSSNQMRSELIKFASQPEISMAEECQSFTSVRKQDINGSEGMKKKAIRDWHIKAEGL